MKSRRHAAALTQVPDEDSTRNFQLAPAVFNPVSPPARPRGSNYGQIVVSASLDNDVNAALRTRSNRRLTEIEVLVAYDSLSSGKRAKELCDRLSKETSGEYELHLGFWNIAALEHPSFAHAALADATSAGFLILAVDANKPLLPSLRSWVARCACRMHAGGGALVAQLHGILNMEREVSPAYIFLNEVAHNAGVEFFSEVIEPEEATFDYSLESIHQRACMRTTVLDAILRLVGSDQFGVLPVGSN
jgi:hypothetical protein